MRDAARHLVERGEDGDRILDRLGLNGASLKHQDAKRDDAKYEGRGRLATRESLPFHGNPSASHHAPHLERPFARSLLFQLRSFSIKRLVDHWGNGVARRPHPRASPWGSP